MSQQRRFFSHETLEKNIGWLIVCTIVVVSIAGFVQILPLFFQHSTTQPDPGIVPYSPLRLMGRDIYIREGCVGCHSQQVRTLQAEVERYGPYSTAGESVYDHPFLWGSKRTGPDLARVGGRYSDDWQRIHLRNPRDVVPESVMPSYPWLAKTVLPTDDIRQRMRTLRTLGVPYSDADIEAAPDALKGRTEEDALVAYLQGLGTNRRTVGIEVAGVDRRVDGSAGSSAGSSTDGSADGGADGGADPATAAGAPSGSQ
ncbi:cytochrome-c oxidase, cbb3-type subunit II [Cupriavidus cauae]|uniref:cytochrome-c oxidase, cbb3-type subunit II n=1 Tax=Cupriavidus cauae TaxID=2608999 RepID=UPI001CC200F1|nr:cytochrome-c oxidase, cbb3-type subunit II [Cupriavidus cauae]